MIAAAPPGSWIWSRAAPKRSSKPGWPPSPHTWRERIEIVAMDGFTGFKSAAAEELPDARAVMDPFHVVHLAGRRSWMSAADASSKNFTTGAGAPRTPCTRPAGCSTPDPAYSPLASSTRYSTCLPAIAHVALEVTWSAYQNIIDAYRAPNTSAGKALMQAEINTLTSTRRTERSSPSSSRWAGHSNAEPRDILAYFDHPHTSNGPTEAINGRLEHLRGSALGFRNLAHYIIEGVGVLGGVGRVVAG